MEETDSDPFAEVIILVADALFQPLSIPVIIGLIVMVVLILCSALISGAEVAFFSLGPAHFQSIRSEKHKNGESLMLLLEQPKRLLATILIANNFVNVAVIVLSTYIISVLFCLDNHPLLAFVLQVIGVTALLLIFGEIMPKILAATRPLRFALMMTLPFRFLIGFFYPLSTLLVKSSGIVDRRIIRKTQQISMSDLSQAIELTSDKDAKDEERKMLKGIVKFGEIDAKEIMKPRLDITAVDVSTRYH
ncbi:MAG TPA: CNNM domain-containing protein, partial [Bacteroidales bacterium]|nr:CNNM domain-containing protein [Bacteroidales bacterium]